MHSAWRYHLYGLYWKLVFDCQYAGRLMKLNNSRVRLQPSPGEPHRRSGLKETDSASPREYFTRHPSHFLRVLSLHPLELPTFCVLLAGLAGTLASNEAGVRSLWCLFYAGTLTLQKAGLLSNYICQWGKEACISKAKKGRPRSGAFTSA